MDRTCFSRCREAEVLVGGWRSEGAEGTGQRPGRMGTPARERRLSSFPQMAAGGGGNKESTTEKLSTLILKK